MCETNITAVFTELDIRQEDGCMGSRWRETWRPTWMLGSGKTHWKPAGGEHRVGSREEPGVSRQLLQKVCGKEHGWPAGACELLLRDIQPIISSDPGACTPKQVWSGHREA